LAARPGNVFISPVSIAGAFGPVLAGARGETRAEMLRALALPDRPELHDGLGEFLRRLERETPGMTLSIANALWTQAGFAIRPAFLSTARRDYGATVESVDFREADAAARRINAWVGRETRNRIPTLVTPQALPPATRLVVTNAVYFLGDWAEAFDARGTSEQPFYSPGGAVRVPLMHRTDSYRLHETAEFQAIDLPYKDPRLSLSVFLPRSREGLPAFEEGLTDERLGAWLAELDAQSPREVRLFLPRFKAEAQYGLVPQLQALGMPAAFDPRRADFRDIADVDLVISDVIHKTFLKLDEKGTEATAATAVIVVQTSARPEPPTFRADRPFFLVLRDKESGAMLFLGRIVRPNGRDARIVLENCVGAARRLGGRGAQLRNG